LFETYRERGLVVLGFPCNQFGSQEPAADSEIQTFCSTNYGVSFPVFSKIEVNGASAAPLYKWLKASKPGILGIEAVKWNFTKFLVGKNGEVIGRYGPQVSPKAIAHDIEKALGVS
jgi:glutathione peroxidase